MNSTSNTISIFVSSKMKELSEERKLIGQHLTTLRYGGWDLQAWVFEDSAPASEKTIRDIYLEALANSALYIGIFGTEYGEWTIDEFEHATKWGIDRHIYVRNADGMKRNPKLQEFLNQYGQVQSGVTAKWFETLDQLRDAVTQSISVWLRERMMLHPAMDSAIVIRNSDQVMERPKRLIGRGTLIKEIRFLVDKRERILLHGFSGSGKTALAAEVAAQWINENKKPVVWLRAGTENASGLFEAIARAFSQENKISKEPVSTKSLVILDILAQSSAGFFVLDDAWNSQALTQLMKAIPHNMALLVTSRQRYPISNIVSVPSLTHDDAMDLLSFYSNSSLSQSSHASTLCTKLGYNPFAIRIAGLTLAVDEISPKQLLDQIGEAPHKIELPLDFSEEGKVNMASLLKSSLNALYLSSQEGREAYAVFMMLGAFFAPNITLELLSLGMTKSIRSSMSLLTIDSDLARERHFQEMSDGYYVEPDKIDTESTENALRVLHRRGLIDRIPFVQGISEHYRMHELAYSFASEQAPILERHTALDACLVYSNKHSEPTPGVFSAIFPILGNLMSAADWAATAGRWSDMDRLVTHLCGETKVLLHLGLYEKAIRLLNIAAYAARSWGEYEIAAWHLLRLGSVNHSVGKYKEAIECNEAALELFRREKEQDGEASSLHNIGLVLTDLGNFDKARAYFQKALSIFQETNNEDSIRSVGQSIGLLYWRLGEYEQAIKHFPQLTEHELEGYEGPAGLLTNIGLIYCDQGKHEIAIKYHERALFLARKTRSEETVTAALANLGRAYSKKGQHQKALEFYQEAQKKATEIGHKLFEGNIVGSVGYTYMVLGQYDKSLEFHKQALEIHSEIGASHEEAGDLSNIGLVYLLQNQHGQAFEYIEKAQEIYQAIGAVQQIERCNHILADILEKSLETANTLLGEKNADTPQTILDYCRRGMQNQRKGLSEKAIQDFTKVIEFNATFEYIYYLRAMEYYKLNKRQLSLVDLEKAISLGHDLITQAQALALRGIIYQDTGNLEAAISSLDQAIEIAPWVAQFHFLRGNAHGLQKNLIDAIADFSRAIELDHQHASAYTMKGLALRLSGCYSEAIELYRTAIQALPQNASIYHQGLSIAARLAGSYQEARESLLHIMASDSERIDIHIALASVYDHEGDTEKHLKHINHARNLCQDTTSDYDKACIESVAGNIEEALNNLAVAAKMEDFDNSYASIDPDLENARTHNRFWDIIAVSG